MEDVLGYAGRHVVVTGAASGMGAMGLGPGRLALRRRLMTGSATDHLSETDI
jgi:hypothetical protein